MTLKTVRYSFILLLLSIGLFSTASAQANNEQARVENPEIKIGSNVMTIKLFEIKYRDPNVLSQALQSLGSGQGRASITPNPQLKTLTVRDYPENISAIEAAIKRLDVPEPAPVSLELQIHLIAASSSQEEGSPFPKNLEPVLTQLKSTLRYNQYRYITTGITRVNDGGKAETSGVTSALFPAPTPASTSFYSYRLGRLRLTQDAAGKETVQISNFAFSVSVPVATGQGGQNVQYRDIGIVTELSLREGETAVVGTANVSSASEAIIVVVSVKKVR